MTKTQVVEKAMEELDNNSVEEMAKPKRRMKGNLPTTCDLWNQVIGGGFPYGFVNIVGDSSSGKSFLAGEILASAYHNYGKEHVDWFYDNAEGGYRFNSNKLYGFDVLKGGFLSQDRRSNTIEDFERNIKDIIKKKDPAKWFIYILDSYDSISSEDEIKFVDKKLRARKKEDSDDDEGGSTKTAGTYNLAKQKEGHSFFRTTIRALEDNKIFLIIVSQVKEKIGATMFQPKLYRTGGKALDFYPNIVIWLAEVEKYMRMARPVGICTKILATKSRNDKPFRSCLVDLIFDYGLDNVSTNINFLYDLKTDGTNKDKKNLKCEWDGVEYTRDELIDFIESNNLESVLAERTVKKWEEIEDAISSKDRKSRWQE